MTTTVLRDIFQNPVTVPAIKIKEMYLLEIQWKKNEAINKQRMDLYVLLHQPYAK